MMAEAEKTEEMEDLTIRIREEPNEGIRLLS